MNKDIIAGITCDSFDTLEVEGECKVTQWYSTGIGIRPTFILPRVPVLQDSQSVKQSLLELLSHVNTYGKQHLQKMKKQLSMIIFPQR